MSSTGLSTNTSAFFLIPLVSKKFLEIFTIVLPFQAIVSLFSSVTVATNVVSTSSSLAYSLNLFKFSLSITTAILSWDSDKAISVPSNPGYLTGTLSRSINSPSANSPIATETPPAPKSLHFLIILLTFSFLKSLTIFLSKGGFPFCTSAPPVSKDSSVCFLDEPTTPPNPSLPVLPPNKRIKSPGSPDFLITFSFGAAATKAPTSILLAT